MKDLRFAVEDATRGRDFNNLLGTRLADIKRVLGVAKERVTSRLKVKPGAPR